MTLEVWSHEDWITESQEKYLLGKIQEELSNGNYESGAERSRVLRFGWGYRPASIWLRDIPPWVVFPLPGMTDFDSVTINEYQPGDSISPHIDSFEFGPRICILNLHGSAELVFTREGQRRVVPARRRGLLIMDGEARSHWKHSVPPVPELRYSLVYRKRL